MSHLSLSVRIEVSPRGIKSLVFDAATEPGLHWKVSGNPEWNSDIDRWMETYAAGQQPDVTLPYDLSALPSFTQIVLADLQEIPFGDILSYGAVAERLGMPRGARAVGNACGRNPVPLMIPCHRVIAANGSLGGFSLDPRIKVGLLAHEGRKFGTPMA